MDGKVQFTCKNNNKIANIGSYHGYQQINEIQCPWNLNGSFLFILTTNSMLYALMVVVTLLWNSSPMIVSNQRDIYMNAKHYH